MGSAIGDLVATLNMNTRPFESGVSRGRGSLRRLVGAAGAAAAQVAKVGVAAGAAAAVFGIKAASDMEETMNKFNVVFGRNAEAVKAWGDNYADQAGRSKQQIADFMASSQDLFVPLGFEAGAAGKMSQTLTKLSVDLASFNNLSDAAVLRDLQAAMTGSGETMKKYGVIVSEAAVKQELLSQGMSKKQTNAASDAAKVQARLNIIMRGTTAAQGDAIRSAGSFANQMKALRGKVSDAGVAIGQQLLPVVTPLLSKLVKLVPAAGQAFAKLIAGAKVVSKTLGGAVREALGNIWAGIKQISAPLHGVFGPLADGAKSAFSTVVSNLDVMLGSVDGFKAGAVNLFYQTAYALEAIWEQAKNTFMVTWEGLRGWWGGFWNSMQQGVTKTVTPWLSRMAIKLEKMKTEMSGGTWHLTTEDENNIVNDSTRQAMAELERLRIQGEHRTNQRLEELQKQHDQKMAGIGKKSLEQTEKWKQQTGELPTLSGQVAGQWKKTANAGKATDPFGAAFAGGGPGDMTNTAATERKYAGAATRGSAQAYSNVVNAMRGGGDRAKESRDKKVAKNSDKQVIMLGKISRKLDKQSEVSIPR